MATEDRAELKLTEAQERDKQEYVKFVSWIAGDGIIPAMDLRAVRRHQRVMAEHSVDTTAALMFDIGLMKSLGGDGTRCALHGDFLPCVACDDGVY